ncbi:TPA: DUF4393 domain-containing protein [Legionella pneumophila]|nr:DUF4393 domain-containing protein [Legionella pneumophila]HBD9320617.1 DUF4393 domain-containing protein [Legionella pneumophila]HBD9332841.1 DUF4393 domain-containing protein [Legionella pneumophila]
MNELTISAAVSFLAAIGLKEPFKQLGLLASEQIQSWRFNNLVKIIAKSAKTCEEHGVKLRNLPNSFTIPFLEAAQNQEDDELQNIWAALLSNLVLGNPVHPSYINVIKDLTSIEVRVLLEIYTHYTANQKKYISKDTYLSLIENELLTLSHDNSTPLNTNLIIGNLQRLNLLRFVMKNNVSQVEITSYAIDLIHTCKKFDEKFVDLTI